MNCFHLQHLQNEGEDSHFQRDILETVFAFQTAAFSLRSIAVVLRRGGKPLFGAWNARQVIFVLLKILNFFLRLSYEQ